jgi:hypothetical protein
MRGVYLVAAELAKRGFVASPTSRSAFGADVLVTDTACRRSYSVQVKTNARTFDFWLVSERAITTVSRTHLYVLVNLRPTTNGESIEFYVVPSKAVARLVRKKEQANSTWYWIRRSDLLKYRDRWSLFGEA